MGIDLFIILFPLKHFEEILKCLWLFLKKVLEIRKHEIVRASEYFPFRGWISSTDRFEILAGYHQRTGLRYYLMSSKHYLFYSTHIYILKRKSSKRHSFQQKLRKEKQDTRIVPFPGTHAKERRGILLKRACAHSLHWSSVYRADEKFFESIVPGIQLIGSSL